MKESTPKILFFHCNWATSRENVPSGIFKQVRFKPACSATEASRNLETLDIWSRHIILPMQRTTKVLIRLHRCAGWSAPLLFAYGIIHVFAWPGPANKVRKISHKLKFNVLNELTSYTNNGFYSSLISNTYPILFGTDFAMNVYIQETQASKVSP